MVSYRNCAKLVNKMLNNADFFYSAFPETKSLSHFVFSHWLTNNFDIWEIRDAVVALNNKNINDLWDYIKWKYL